VEQPRIEFLAAFDDSRQERGERRSGVVGVGAAAADGRRHQHGAGQNGPGFEQPFLGRDFGRLLRASPDGLERHLLQDETPVPAVGIDFVRIPLAEMVIRPFVDRMIEIVGPRIDGPLGQERGIEVGPGFYVVVRGPQDRQGLFEQGPINIGGESGPFEIDRNRGHPFVCVRFQLPLVIEHGDRPMADKVVQPGDGFPR
jgi:hypothetical protein